MSRTESDRDDLLAEVVALTRRVELRTTARNEPIVAGFRSNGWLSIYFGSDPMYQFDEIGRLRRGFVGGLLYRSQGTTLARLRRERTETETSLLRRDLTEPELVEFQRAVRGEIGSLWQQLASDLVEVLRQVPEDDARLLDDIAVTLEFVLNSPEFLAPAIARKK